MAMLWEILRYVGAWGGTGLIIWFKKLKARRSASRRVKTGKSALIQ